MKRFNTKLTGTIILALALVSFAPAANALEPTVVTFDNGTEGWTANPDCETIQSGGPDGDYWNFVNRLCDDSYVVRAFFRTWTDSNPDFIGDYTARGPFQVSVDVNVNVYDFAGWFGTFEVEEDRTLVVEFIDHDHAYTDPDTGYSWPWTSVQFVMDNFQDREDGWKTFTAEVQNPNSTELLDGWIGFGGPELPPTYLPGLPPDYTFADVMAGVDEIQFHSIEPGWFYSIGFIHDMDFDNITVRELPRTCANHDATIWVDNSGIVHGGPYDGMIYNGELPGTEGDDVIVGTNGDDAITANKGNDIICGWDGNDTINGQQGNDVIFGDGGDDNLLGQLGDDIIDGGAGYDHINGGPGANMCSGGEHVQHCGVGGPGAGRRNSGDLLRRQQFDERLRPNNEQSAVKKQRAE